MKITDVSVDKQEVKVKFINKTINTFRYKDYDLCIAEMDDELHYIELSAEPFGVIYRFKAVEEVMELEEFLNAAIAKYMEM